MRSSIPPGFVRYLEAHGLTPPHCMWCKFSADVEANLVCNRFGAIVGLYSSCRLFEGLPQWVLGRKDISREQLAKLWPEGVLDLRD